MKAERLNLQRDINRLMFESVIALPDDETARIALETEEQILAELAEKIAPLQKGIDQLSNQFWVTKKEVQANKYDFSASRYRPIEADEIFYEEPNITLAPPNIETAIIDSHLFRMRVDKNRVFPPYLCYAINGYQGLKRQLKQMARGAIMDGLNTTILKECSIPLFTLEKQKRIAAILDKTDRLRRQHRFAQTLSDSFLQTVFNKLFDVTGKGWQELPRFTVGDVSERVVVGYAIAARPIVPIVEMRISSGSIL